VPDIQQQLETTSTPDTTAAIAPAELILYRHLRKQQLLAQVKDITNLRADVDRRKLSLIINQAIAAAFE
jgi:hypothetical protein